MNSQPLVLVADDEPRITKLVALTLHDEGFRVVTAGGGEEALKKAEEVRPDIVLLDIVMPDLDGIEVMRQLREWRPVPVILLTAKGSTSDKAKGLDLGADDYIAKPFHPDELAARVRAVLRRASGVSPGAGIVAFDDIEIDLERRLLTKGGELVSLSRTEWLLLQHLAAHAGKVVLHTELLTKVWGPEYRDDPSTCAYGSAAFAASSAPRPARPGPSRRSRESATFWTSRAISAIQVPATRAQRLRRRRPAPLKPEPDRPDLVEEGPLTFGGRLLIAAQQRCRHRGRGRQCEQHQKPICAGHEKPDAEPDSEPFARGCCKADSKSRHESSHGTNPPGRNSGM